MENMKSVFNRHLKQFFMSASWGRDCDELNAIAYAQNKVTGHYDTTYFWVWCDATKEEMIEECDYFEMNRDTFVSNEYTVSKDYVDLVTGNVPF